MQTWEGLRDLADKLDKVARDHACHSIVHEITSNCVSHIRAVARVHELNAASVTDDEPVLPMFLHTMQNTPALVRTKQAHE